ncbi:MAG: hypothetical protein HQL46_04615 [Gammaproteobacteria bacterium]|nr:hypothetical protein [Gammaproteobacteria bacterium]
MRLLSKISIMLLFSLLSFNSYADRAQPYHLCFQPEKPLLLASRYQIELYNKDIIAYDECITKFIQEQKRDISMHESAIRTAQQEKEVFNRNHKK